MAERTEYAPGTPNWIDLQTTDPSAAKQFYGELLGWSFEDLPIDAANGVFYSMGRLKGRDVGAIAPLGDLAASGVPPHWNSYVSVSDVDATAGQVAPAGGTVVAPPFDVMDAGRMAVIQDPTGAILQLWQAKNHPGAGLVNEPGTWSWNELMTPDVDKALAFYNKIFGWTANKYEGEMPYWEIQLDGNAVGGATNPPMPGIPPNWGIYFSVAGCDATVAEATAKGASVLNPPMDLPVGRLAILADPQGAAFNVITLNEA